MFKHDHMFSQEGRQPAIWFCLLAGRRELDALATGHRDVSIAVKSNNVL